MHNNAIVPKNPLNVRSFLFSPQGFIFFLLIINEVIIRLNRDLKNTNSTKFLELELKKLEKLSAIEEYEFRKIRRIANLLKEQNLIKINGQMEKVNLTPDLSVSLMSFAIFGFSLSLFLCVIIGIFSSRIGIKKLKALLNPK